MKLSLFFRAFYRAFISPTKRKISYSQFAEDLLIKNLLGKKEPGFYVDIGCHHPRRGSNTYGLYKSGWRGLLVDLEVDKVLACKLARPRDKVILAAVGGEGNKLVGIYTPKSFSTNTTIDINRLSESTDYKKVGDIYTKTLGEIFFENKIPKVFDLLAVDVEGLDFDVIKSVSLEEYKPKLICVESWQSLKGVDSLISTPMHQYLSSKNYILMSWSGVSTIYMRS